jgi:hypothetical protein
VAFLLMFSLQCLFPIFESSRVDEFLGVSIVNRESQDGHSPSRQPFLKVRARKPAVSRFLLEANALS